LDLSNIQNQPEVCSPSPRTSATSPGHLQVAEPETPVMTVDEVAALLRLNRKTIYDAVREGSLPALRLGRTIRLSRGEVLRWLASVQSKKPW
jgi:excisionase family DNA binding protein